ncbi:MAG: ABC transporter permease [Clostridiales bacterium]|nr:ABC transporter permease [Clostridiales bacterium]
MNKLLLLTKSHIKKNKGSSAGLAVLMLIAGMLIGLSLLLMLDAVSLAKTEAVRLNAGDGFIKVYGDLEKYDDGFIADCLGDDVEDFEVNRTLGYSDMPLPFGDSTISNDVIISDKSAFDRRLSVVEIVDEDASITSDYVILPYVFHTSGKFNVGDKFSFDLQNRKFDLTIRGFVIAPYFGVTNAGNLEVIVDDETYNEIYESDIDSQECLLIPFKLKDGVKESKFAIEAQNTFMSKAPESDMQFASVDEVILARTFMSLIIAVSNIVTTSVILIVILLMLVSNITNYVRENMKTIGALKAIGYTSKDLNKSLILLFLILAVIGSLIGTVCAYLIMPIVSKFAIAQMGLPYHVSFNLLASFVPFVAIVTYTFLVSVLALRKIRKIEPIVALREGTESHNFKKNHFALEKSSSGLNLNLGLKTMMTNRKQNIITFFIVGAIVFLCTMSLLMFENFNRNPKYEIMTFEKCGVSITFDAETKDEAAEFISRNGGENPREIDSIHVTYNKEDKLLVKVVEDTSKLESNSGCYKGRVPEYDNEIAVSGKFAKDYGFSIGDEVKIVYGDSSFSYIISGFIQSANNLGREGVLTKAGAEHLVDFTNMPATFCADTKDSDASRELIEKCSDKYGSHILSKVDVHDALAGSLSTFSGLSTMMLVIISIISAIVIVLVLFLLIKALIYNKRKDYGIYKAIGYTSKDLILQTALSFMPSIMISTVIFAVVSYYIANPYMNIAMISFGICKADFDIPIPGLIIIAVLINILSFFFALFEARKIKKIEAYNMLVAE